MPKCGSQIILCDLPIRFDTYKGCGHGCQYCFAQRHKSIKNITGDESYKGLLSFVKGKRDLLTNWCDWEIPLHWGGESDPFQPAEREMKRSLKCLEVFAETGYPFVVSTKSTLLTEEPYLSLIKKCNCVIQISMLTSRYDGWEKGAPTFEQRLKCVETLAAFKRVIIRCQPYIPHLLTEMLRNLRRFSKAGAYGVIFEAMKFFSRKEGTIRFMGDNVYPADLLKEHFELLKEEAHKNGLRFFCGENRLRSLSDSLCCCGIEGMGWKENKANFNHWLYDKEGFVFSKRQTEEGSGFIFMELYQNTLASKGYKKLSYADAFKMNTKWSRVLIPEKR